MKAMRPPEVFMPNFFYLEKDSENLESFKGICGILGVIARRGRSRTKFPGQFQVFVHREEKEYSHATCSKLGLSRVKSSLDK